MTELVSNTLTTLQVYQSFIGTAAAGGAVGLAALGMMSGEGMPSLMSQEMIEAALAGGASAFLMLKFSPGFDTDNMMMTLAIGAAGAYIWSNYARGYAESFGIL